ncbi:hypothetical protein LEP1GSC034_3920 [Leptospira interrogans str. 2003000735]|nr:hypothetical protein LIL_13025 [Leptospira interrogans serovar Linhai str. 56609]EJP04233.1 hypothetical protein LEP1GSC007_0192 [Leptospira interrogans serovar Bulgarica str. Mallika]EJP18302.1 hypothetical protein LEP1GSC080_2972 [Leptospira interrogans str. FPW2026]EKN87765.1 hypothetical protein LEP1GSC027_4352 [Leptospira interrogans str. 2002000624]EKO07465.1 hypothetical protein LEP1GSC077_4183 [Leptospira interrogans str. C10069]EKO24511.1 hypothetical protein LEP1GSC104_0677 [Lepto
MNFLKTNEERKFHLKDSISRILIFKFNKKLKHFKIIIFKENR